MKKIILLLIIFPIWVNAKSIISSSINEQGYYTNYNGVEISQEVYTKIKNKLSEEEIEEITPTLYEELESSVEIKNVNLPYQPDYNVTLFYLHNNDRKNILTKEKYNYFNIKEKDSKINYQNYLDNLYLEIKFVDYYNNTFVNETIKLKFTIDTNKKEKTNLNLKQIYLLQNNDYKSENYSCFVKKNTNTIFEYNFQNNYLKYEKKKII